MAGALDRPTRPTYGRSALQDAVEIAWVRHSGLPPEHLEPIAGTAYGLVFRIHGALSDGHVVAKVSRLDEVATEASIFERILPLVPVRSLKCYGFASLDSFQKGVLFLEDAGEERPDRWNPTHAALVGNWLAAVHTCTSTMLRPEALPAHGLERYESYRALAIGSLKEGLQNLRLRTEHAQIMIRLIQLLETVEAAIPRIETVADDFPSMLVHGDLMVKNMRIRHVSAGNSFEVLPFDWEAGGWGPPLPDLSRLRRGFHSAGWNSYVSRVVPEFAVGEETLQMGARAGRILRIVAAIFWASMSLSAESVEQMMRDQMVKFESDLGAALTAI